MSSSCIELVVFTRWQNYSS